MGLQSKITLLFFLIATTGVILINASIFYFISDFNFEDFFKRLETRVSLTAETNIHPDERASSYKEVRSQHLEKLADEKEYIVKLSGDGRMKRPLPLPDEFYKTILSGRKARYNEGNEFYAGSLFSKKNEHYVVIVSASDPSDLEELETLKTLLLLVFLVSLCLTFVIGKIFSHFTVKPVQSVISSVQNISANNLHLRLEERKGNDEIAKLILTFNNMLNRLETAFETQNNFVSNASHELKTPLSVITGELDLLLAKNKLEPETEKSIQIVQQHVERLTHIITSLLGLAQTGFDGKKQSWQKIRVDELVMIVADSVKKIDPESKLQLDFSDLPSEESEIYTEGNMHLLQLALSNIVLNACKYSNNQLVLIKVAIENGMIAMMVTDLGIGIPTKEQQHIFEPFFRASNTSDFDGFGIGLPLTLNIVRLHHGTIGIRSEEEHGTEMRILLPISSGV